jgi:hypothetical protein
MNFSSYMSGHRGSIRIWADHPVFFTYETIWFFWRTKLWAGFFTYHGFVTITTSSRIISRDRCSWIMVYVLYCNAQVNLIVILMIFVCLLYSINCPTVIFLPSMLFILWRDTTSELWTPVHSFTLLLPFTIYSLYLHSCKLLSFTTRYS